MPEADAVVTRPALPSAYSPPIARRFCSAMPRRTSSAQPMPAGGALTGIVEATVEAMATLGAKPERIVAVIGPPSRGRPMRSAPTMSNASSPMRAPALLLRHRRGSGEPHFDLPAMSARGCDGPVSAHFRSRPVHLLRQSGCSAIGGRCTMAKTITAAISAILLTW
jgi:hypothetical protein